MTYSDTPLWQALAAMLIEPPGAAISFTAKLARETGWSPAFAAAAVEEYRRFLYLAGVAGHAVSPSRAVDKAWHLHLTYSRHYWDELCGRILGRPFHHDPSLGGAAEDRRHADQYARTLALYRATFGEEPPAAIWGGAEARAPVGRSAAAVVGIAGTTLLLAACSAAGGEDNWLVFPVLFVFAIMAVAFFRTRASASKGRKRKTGSGGGDCGTSSCGNNSDSDSGSSSDGGSSCGGGGCGGGGD